MMTRKKIKMMLEISSSMAFGGCEVESVSNLRGCWKKDEKKKL
jgi:hypothetical protein